MKTRKNNAKFIVVIMVILFITCFAIPAFAASATIDVEVVVYKQTGGGSEPYANVQVTLGQNSKNTSRRGNVEFRLENIPTTTMVTLSTADPNIPNGSHSKLNLKLDTATTEVVHSNGPGIYDIYIAYTKDTTGIVIKFMVTQNDEWEILPIEFNQQNSNNPPPAPNEPEPHDPEPDEIFGGIYLFYRIMTARFIGERATQNLLNVSHYIHTSLIKNDCIIFHKVI